MLETTDSTNWLTQRNLPSRGRLSREAVIYCLVYLARRPHDVPREVVAALVESGAISGFTGTA